MNSNLFELRKENNVEHLAGPTSVTRQEGFCNSNGHSLHPGQTEKHLTTHHMPNLKTDRLQQAENHFRVHFCQ